MDDPVIRYGIGKNSTALYIQKLTIIILPAFPIPLKALIHLRQPPLHLPFPLQPYGFRDILMRPHGIDKALLRHVPHTAAAHDHFPF